jgi:hypothetical protein
MTIYTVFTLARQIEGDYVFAIVDKGFLEKPKAEARWMELKQQYYDTRNVPKIIHIKNEMGEADCKCEIALFEIEVEQGDQGDQ